MNRVSILLVLLFANTEVSLGMCVSKTYTPVAWNSNGTSSIVHLLSPGPEGGGSESYLVVDFVQQKSTVFEFSSDFGSGGGISPQRISVEMCKNRVIEANQILSKLGFPIKFNESLSTCVSSRSNLLTTNAQLRGLLKAGRATDIGKKLGITSGKTRPIVATKDGVHFILIKKNSTCSAECIRVTLNKTDQTYKNDGSCI